MELQQLEYFKTVAAIGKISDAAEAPFISPIINNGETFGY